MRLLGTKDLPAKGITYSPESLRRLIKAGQFPRPLKRPGGRLLAWPEEEIDRWIADLIATRDGRRRNAEAA